MRWWKKAGIWLLAAGILAAAVLTVCMVRDVRRSRSVSLAAHIHTATAESIAESAPLIVFGVPAGSPGRFREADGLSFRLTEFSVEEAVRCTGEVPETVRILQTEGLCADVTLEKGKRYCLFFEPYIMGSAEVMRPAEGAYVIAGAFKGVYEADGDALRAVRTPYETEEQAASREREMQERLQEHIKSKSD